MLRLPHQTLMLMLTPGRGIPMHIPPTTPSGMEVFMLSTRPHRRLRHHVGVAGNRAAFAGFDGGGFDVAYAASLYSYMHVCQI